MADLSAESVAFLVDWGTTDPILADLGMVVAFLVNPVLTSFLVDPALADPVPVDPTPVIAVLVNPAARWQMFLLVTLTTDLSNDPSRF